MATAKRTAKRAAAPRPKRVRAEHAHPEAAKAAPFGALHFIDEDGHPVDLPLMLPMGEWRALEEAAMEWNYVLRSRQRWLSTRASEEHITRATETLWSFDVTPYVIERLARAPHIEVRLGAFDDNDGGWSLRIFPWEYVIAAATRPYRHGSVLTVTRLLDVARKRLIAAAARSGPPRGEGLRVLYVESAPGDLGKDYDFHGERELIGTYLTAGAAVRFSRLYAPTLAQLSDMVKALRPHVVHLAGIDSHEAGIRLRWKSAEGSGRAVTPQTEDATDEDVTDQQDGYVVNGGAGQPEAAGAKDLANALTAGRTWFPWLVCMNFENSASRLAARVVQWGCGNAVGIQDAIDAGIAEMFFGTFYAGLRQGDWDPPAAFRAAWDAVRRQPADLIGTGVVLWAGTPAPGVARRRAGQRHRAPERRRVPTVPEETALDWARAHIGVSARPRRDINYSLLHNGGTLFDEFSLKPSPDVVLQDVTVRAVLRAGQENAEFVCAVDLEGRPVDLRHRIKVALSAELIRSVHEAINTTWLVEVIWGRHVLLRDTFPVRLLPIDQWRDAASSRSWLPSFVFPRDRAVAELITKAANYVRVLRDDPLAGFEGYQCLPNKDRLTPADAQEVDLQVQAIWSAILYEWRLTYINPPPTYSIELDSQRLRTPGMIARDRVGTCIDLALLLAAALELVDIRPVIILLEGHAFPAYWRADSFHERFSQATPEPETIREITGIGSDATGVGGIQLYPWAVGRAMVREILHEVRSGRLVPLETVRLTEHAGFAEAMEAGRENFADPSQFEFLIDIAIARQHNITPLPLLGEEA